MARVYNFSAGPGTLPEEVLKQASEELLDYKGSGMSVMEMSHRSPWYENIHNKAISDLREIMNIPDNYKVLFLQGGAHLQFSMIPLNLKKNGKADYLVAGTWGKKASAEAKKYLTVNVVASSEDKKFTYHPKVDPSLLTGDADYYHVTTNNTVYGTRLRDKDTTCLKNVPLVADMSSNILSEVYDVSRFGVIYAGAQKNMGPAGVTVVIIREDLIRDTDPMVPTMLQYKTHSESNSLYNTPPCYSIYVCGLVYDWVKRKGGVGVIHAINEKKAALIYDYIDRSNLFKGTVEKYDRSIMNVNFVTGSEELDKKFIREAGERGLVNLKGYRTVGGMRASIYNAMPVEGVQALVEFMKDFEANNI
ncbi:MAG TPA: 3-phosphoserine/phosphohydroxythreonine aminotransferase [Ruminiclostridium sp.]|nr:3-phosphoserine/phosphohydroxythreonine aminotransferase [Ruminiclostridium sp.]